MRLAARQWTRWLRLVLALGALLGSGAPTFRADTTPPAAAVQVLRAARQRLPAPQSSKRSVLEAPARRVRRETAAAAQLVPNPHSPRVCSRLYLERRVLLI